MQVIVRHSNADFGGLASMVTADDGDCYYAASTVPWIVKVRERPIEAINDGVSAHVDHAGSGQQSTNIPVAVKR